MNSVEKRELMKDVYEEYFKELYEKCPEFKSENYSCPYFMQFPTGWFNAENRIMIIGEEGYGIKPNGTVNVETAMAEMMEFNFEYMRDQLQKGDMYKYKRNNSAFWRRIRNISDLDSKAVFAWTNIDKIHGLKPNKCKLSDEDRKKLHSISTKVLAKEIEIFEPTMIIFFGWYGISLKHEWKEAFDLLYPNGDNDNSLWKKKVVYKKINGIDTIFSYHPSWGCRQDGYEEKVLETVKEHLR